MEKLILDRACSLDVYRTGYRLQHYRVRKQAGFSLIELAVVVAIIGIVALIAMPNMIGWRAERKLEGAARNCMSDMQLAKLNAIRESENVAVLFIPPNQYSIFIDTNNNGVADPGEQVLRSRTLPTGVTISNITFSGNVTHFNPRGLPSLAGIGRVVFSNNNGSSRTIFLNSVGRLRIQ